MEFKYKNYCVRIVQNPNDIIVRFTNKRIWERTFLERDFVELQVLGGLEFVGNLLASVLDENAEEDETVLSEIIETPKNLSFSIRFAPAHIKALNINFTLSAIKLDSASTDLESLAKQISDLNDLFTNKIKALEHKLDEEIEKNNGHIVLPGCSNAISVSVVNLGDVELPNKHYIKSIKNLKYLTNCTSLKLDSTSITDFSPIGFMTNLQSLDLSSSVNLTDISWIVKLKQLSQVNFYNCNNLEDISPLKNLPNLKGVRCKQGTKVMNTSFLGSGINIS